MEGDKSMIIKQLDVSIEKQAQEEYQASQVQSTKDELASSVLAKILMVTKPFTNVP